MSNITKEYPSKYIQFAMSLSLGMICFFPLLIGRREYVPIVFFVCLSALLIQKKTFFISPWAIILAVVFCVWLFCGLFSNNLTNYKELIYTIIVVVAIIMADQISGWEDSFLKLAWGITFFYVMTTVVQYFSPRLITVFNHFLLNTQNFEANLAFLNKGAYAGITNQTGVNGYFICVFIAITTSKFVLHNSYKVRKGFFTDVIYFIVLSLGYFALFLTKKRIFLIAALLYTMLVLLLVRRIMKINISLLLIGGIAIYFVIGQTNILDEYLSRFIFSNSNDYSSGRFNLWNQSIQLFTQKPFFGWGWFSTFRLLQIDGRGEVPHNTFLQILVEVGIIGFVAYIGLLCFYFFELKRAFNRNVPTLGLLCSMCFQVIFVTWSLTGNPIWSGYPFYLFLLTYPIIRSSDNKIRLCKEILLNEN